MKQYLKTISVLLLFFIPLIYFDLNYKTAITVGRSMDPTIRDGETLIISQNKEPKVGDIVSVHVNRQYGTDAEYIVKRIAAIENGKMYLLGDNAEVSYDSRYYGYVPMDWLDGVVIYHH